MFECKRCKDLKTAFLVLKLLRLHNLLIFIITCCSTFTTTAQVFKYGVIGGLNVSKIENFGGYGLEENIQSFHFGGIVEYSLSRTLSLESALLYSEEGENFDNSSGTETSVKLSFINIPVQLKYYLSENISLLAGPQVGFPISTRVKNLTSRSFTDPINTALSITGAIGYELAEYNLYFKGSLIYGVNDVIENDESVAFDPFLYGVESASPQRLVSVQLSISYKFGNSVWKLFNTQKQFRGYR
jgi:hypothetical protein